MTEQKEQKEKRPRGRPAVPAAERKARNLTFRTGGDMHDRLSAAAVEAGRSINEEIEARLGQSFEIEQRIDDLEKRASEAENWARETEKLASEVQTLAREEFEKNRVQLQQVQEKLDLLQQVQEKLDLVQMAASIIDVLLGKNEASSNLLRRVALELANSPDWASSEAGTKAMAERLRAVVTG